MVAGVLIDTGNLQDQAKTQLLDMTIVRRLYDGCPKVPSYVIIHPYFTPN